MRWLKVIFDHLFPIQRVIDWIEPYLHLGAEDAANPEALRLHRRIVRWGAITGISTSLAWSTVSAFALIEGIREGADDDWLYLLIVPLVALGAFVPGTLGGAAAACAITPTWFLLGPGERWIKFVGTKKMTTARIICYASAIFWSPLLLIPLMMIVLMIVMQK